MKTMKSIFYFLFSSLIICLFFEFFLSQAGILKPLVRIDREKGERYIPNEMHNSVFSTEGFGLSESNAAGWFGKEVLDKDRAKNEISISIVGNSYVASRQVLSRNNFISVANNILDEHSSKLNFRINNFGKDAMALGELLYVLEEVKEEHNPDKIFVLINSISFMEKAIRNVPYYKLNGGELELNTDFREKKLVQFYNDYETFARSSLLFLAYRVWKYTPKTPSILFDKFYKSGETKAKTVIPESEKRINESSLAILRELDKRGDITFLIDVKHDFQLEIFKETVVNSPIIDLHPYLLEEEKATNLNPYYWNVDKVEGHWNNRGHIVVGQRLADEIISMYPNAK